MTAFRRRGPQRMLVVLAAAVCAGLAAALVLRASRGSVPRATGVLVDRPVPDLPLLDAQGHTTSLAAFRGKVTVFAPMLTLCHEVCPLTTGALLEIGRAVATAGLARRVALVEISVDPWRDTPARLRAFEKLTGVRLPILTGTARGLRRFWSFFGVHFERTAEGAPPDQDWLTHRQLTFDVAHTDGLFVVDPRGRWRIVDVGMPVLERGLPPKLAGLLNTAGRVNLQHPQAPWTVREALDDIGFVLRRRVGPAS